MPYLCPKCTYLKFSGESIYVKQNESTLQIVTGWQTRNHYTLYDTSGSEIGFLAERDTGVLGVLGRLLLRRRRSFLMDLYEPSGKLVASLSRPFYWFFSELSIDSSAGERIGTVKKRFTFIRPLYDLFDFQGQCLGKLLGTFLGGRGLGNILLGNQNYSLLDSLGIEELSGGVERQWNGVLNRTFTEKDSYIVKLPGDWTDEQKLVLLSAAISIDFDYYESSDGLLREGSVLGAVAGILSGSRSTEE